MTLKIDLPDEKTAALAAKARTQGLSPEEYARQVLEHDIESGRPAAEQPLHAAAEIVLKSIRRVPPEDLAALPKDGASQHDHYIYGWPKREP